MRAGELPGAPAQFHKLPRLSNQTRHFARQALAGELQLRDEARGTGAGHLLGVAQLVIVGGSAKWNEQSGAASRSDFSHGVCSGAAFDEICLGKLLLLSV
jgi:hypothetical protein